MLCSNLHVLVPLLCLAGCLEQPDYSNPPYTITAFWHTPQLSQGGTVPTTIHTQLAFKEPGDDFTLEDTDYSSNPYVDGYEGSYRFRFDTASDHIEACAKLAVRRLGSIGIGCDDDYCVQKTKHVVIGDDVCQTIRVTEVMTVSLTLSVWE
jgi:hypothetical protein